MIINSLRMDVSCVGSARLSKSLELATSSTSAPATSASYRASDHITRLISFAGSTIDIHCRSGLSFCSRLFLCRSRTTFLILEGFL